MSGGHLCIAEAPTEASTEPRLPFYSHKIKNKRHCRFELPQFVQTVQKRPLW